MTVAFSKLCRREGNRGSIDLRLVAGAGVVAAFLLIGDPAAAVAFADRGGSGSQSAHSGSGRSSDHRGNGDKRLGPKQGVGDHRGRGNADRVRRASKESDASRAALHAPSVDRIASERNRHRSRQSGLPHSRCGGPGSWGFGRAGVRDLINQTRASHPAPNSPAHRRCPPLRRA